MIDRSQASAADTPAGTLHFHPAADLDAAVVSAVQRRIRSRVLRLDEPTTPSALAPRARDPPVLDAGFTLACDRSPWWDSTAAASEPSFHFDQTLN